MNTSYATPYDEVKAALGEFAGDHDIDAIVNATTDTLPNGAWSFCVDTAEFWQAVEALPVGWADVPPTAELAGV